MPKILEKLKITKIFRDGETAWKLQGMYTWVATFKLKKDAVAFRKELRQAGRFA